MLIDVIAAPLTQNPLAAKTIQADALLSPTID